MTTNGHYYYTSNGPTTSLGASTNDGALYSQSYSDSWVGQIAQDYRNGKLFVRGKNNGTWQAWKKIPEASEAVTNITRSGTTFTATKADGTTFTFTQQDNNTTYSAATQSAAGLMSATDKKKLDGVATDANNYTHPTTAGNKHIPAGGSSGQILRWSAAGTAAWGADNNTTYSVATTSANGLMSAADKTKVNNAVIGNGTYPVKLDWNNSADKLIIYAYRNGGWANVITIKGGITLNNSN